ncbi:MAG: hypothetical protein E6J43_11940 [Chloroflexi bacterium]|nr:MAG: hypothetical protein E6J43_11940 [Chloroflexota bacterium]
MGQSERPKQPLTGVVARILNEREIAINLGAVNGVREDMKFGVLSQNPHVITDPNTGETLGELDRPKVYVKVSQVQEKFSVARTYETYTANVGGTAPELGLMQIFRAPRWVTKVKTLRVDQSDLPGELSERDSIVKVKDRVVQVFDDDEEEAEEGGPK